VFRDLCGIAAERGMRVHAHVAESALERSYYQSGNAEMVRIYRDQRAEFALVRSAGAGLGTIDYAESAGLFTAPGHIAHGVYLTGPERSKLRRHGMSVALCPRSNAVIGLDEPPVAALLREGNPVAVGTDSLASAPSLDLLDDVRELYRIARSQGYRDSDLAGRLLVAATLGGGAALGGPSGSLEPGGRADLAAFAMDRGVADPVQTLVERGGGHCLLTVAGGVPLHDRLHALEPSV
jgi:cytosine/adenosine deaminase-related metal-dependent hydrolase